MPRKPVEVTLTKAAGILGGMSRSNVRPFLERYGVEPVVDIPRQRRWLKRDVEAAWKQYQRSGRATGDARRRVAALARSA